MSNIRLTFTPLPLELSVIFRVRDNERIVPLSFPDLLFHHFFCFKVGPLESQSLFVGCH